MINWRKPAIFFLLYATGSKIPRYIKEVTRISQFSDEEKGAYQDAQLKKLLLHAHKEVPYYTRILGEAGVIRGGSVLLEYFNRIPILTKAIVRREGRNLYSRDHRKRGSYTNATGGSTGEPMRLIQDKEYFEWDMATRFFYKRLVGQDVGERELRLLCSDQDLLEGTSGKKERISKRLKNWLYNRRDISSFRVSDERIREIVDVWSSFNPVRAEVYVWTLFEIAQYLKKRDLRISSPGRIVSVAGTLDEEMKKVIEDIFPGPIHDLYGSRESGLIAFGTKRLEVCFWRNKLEVCKVDGLEAHSGKIILTGLNNYAMPLIRYDTGDIGTMHERPFMVESVNGRVINYFKKRNGEKILGAVFARLFYSKNDWCKKFQIIQKNYDLIEIEIVGHKNENDCLLMEKAIKNVMGQSCVVVFKSVADIPSSGSGKHFFAVSEVH